MVCHLMHVSHPFDALLSAPARALAALTAARRVAHHFLLLLGWACMGMAHLCMMHVIRGRTRLGHRVHGKEVHQRWGFRSGRRFAPCPRGAGRGKFSAGRPGMGAGCRFTSQEATRHWYPGQARKCGHTFPPPGGS